MYSGVMTPSYDPSNRQPHDAALDALVTGSVNADTAGTDTEGNPAPLVGFLQRNADGTIRVVAPSSLTLSDVNSAISAALTDFASQRDLDELVTVTEGDLRYMFAFLLTAFGESLAGAADASAGRTLLGLSTLAQTLVTATTEEAMRRVLKVQGYTNLYWSLSFINTSYAPLVGGVIGTAGSIVGTTGSAGHPGVVNILSGTVSGSGYRIYSSNRGVLLGGGEDMHLAIRFPAFTTVTFQVGFVSTGSTNAEPADGVYYWLSGSGVLTPKTSNGSTRTSGNTLTLSVNTWYHLDISLASGAASATFVVKNDAGTVLLNETINTNLPTTATHEVGPSLLISSTDTTGTLVLATVDHFSGYVP